MSITNPLYLHAQPAEATAEQRHQHKEALEAHLRPALGTGMVEGHGLASRQSFSMKRSAHLCASPSLQPVSSLYRLIAVTFCPAAKSSRSSCWASGVS